jgi:alkanesulfonate monooxygenase SsuD/methylene tetrahydromethanopterin reductase-like flavin-dependent oxidoreductase (luciferase family)
MKLGVMIGYWGLGMGPQEQLDVVREAERLGFDSAWAAEAYGSDAATVLAWLAAGTTTIKLGSAIFQMPGRSPAMTAMTAATIELPLPDGPGKALKLTIAPRQEHMPIYLAAIGPNNTALAGEIADGWIPTFFSPEYVADFRELLQTGADRAGRSLEGFDIAPTVQTYVSDDRTAARDLMRPVLALYIGGMGSRKQNFYNNLVQRYGFVDAAHEVQDLYLAGRKAEAGEALPDELIDMVCLCGPRDVVRERLAAYRDAGVGTLMVSPMAFDRQERIEQLRAVAELAT